MSKDFSNRDRLVNGAKGLGERGFHGTLDTLGGFKNFILRGNVVDLAVAVVIGTAFNTLVQEFVKDFINPLIGRISGVSNFNTFAPGGFLVGNFISAFISFIIIAAVVYFFIVKPVSVFQDRYNRLLPKKEKEETTRECPFCLSTVSLKATRCAYCTSTMPPVETATVPPAYPAHPNK